MFCLTPNAAPLATVPAGLVVRWVDDAYGQATPADAVDDVPMSAAAVSAGGFASCAIQKGTGDFLCWGDDGSG